MASGNPTFQSSGPGLKVIHMMRPEISGISPFFIVHDAAAALSFYRDQLGFEIILQEPADDPFFGIVCRGGTMMQPSTFQSTLSRDFRLSEMRILKQK